MNILIASDNKRILNLFESGLASGKNTVTLLPRSDFVKELRKQDQGADFLWYDLTALEEPDWKAALRALARQTRPWGILDKKGVLPDAAEAFWAGASDYVGAKTGTALIDAARLKKALRWAAEKTAAGSIQKPAPESAGKNPAAGKRSAAEKRPTTGTTRKSPAAKTPVSYNFIDSSGGWKAIREGCEYTFTFVYVQIDRTERLLETIGENRLNALDQEFQRMIEGAFAKSGGLVWMWREYGGLLLLPFDGQNCPAILDALQLWLNRPILYAGNAALSVPFTFRMAIHTGNTVFMRPGNTGALTSDTLNSVYHLGYKYLKKDTLYLTEESAAFIPPKLADLFLPAGHYDGRDILRMRAFL